MQSPGKLLWGKFEWWRWEGDPTLKLCSLAAQGLWIRLLCLMQHGEPYGHLTMHGKPPSIPQIAALCGKPPQEIAPLLVELEAAGIFSRSQEGFVYCRKLVREHHVSMTAKINGKMGGNPDITGEKPLRRQRRKRGLTPSRRKGVKPEKEKEKESEEDKKGDPKGSLSAGADVSLPQSVIPTRGDDIQAAYEAWNLIAEELGLGRAVALSETRRRHLKARLAECGGLKGWLEALERLREAPFLLGQTDKQFRADLDFVLQRRSFLRLIEGFYANIRNGQASGHDYLDFARKQIKHEDPT